MRQARPTTGLLRPDSASTARASTFDPPIGLVAGMDDQPADFAGSGRIDFHSADPFGMLDQLAAKPKSRPPQRAMPYLRFAVCFLAFCAIDAAVIFYAVPKWDAATEAARKKPTHTVRQSAPGPLELRQRDLPVRQAIPIATPTSTPARIASTPLYNATALADGLKCSGGIVYKTAKIDGVKVITVLMDSGKPVRCR